MAALHPDNDIYIYIQNSRQKFSTNLGFNWKAVYIDRIFAVDLIFPGGFTRVI